MEDLGYPLTGGTGRTSRLNLEPASGSIDPSSFRDIKERRMKPLVAVVALVALVLRVPVQSQTDYSLAPLGLVAVFSWLDELQWLMAVN